MLLQHQKLVHVEKCHVFVILFKFCGAHVVAVHLTIRARLGNHPHGVTRIASFVLPFQQLVIFGVVDQVNGMKAQSEMIIYPEE